MPIERHFLGWDEPPLPRAASWLRGRYSCPGGPRTQLDLSAVIVVVPVARAGRRLLELLVSERHGVQLVPPRIVTVGQLPELLYDASAVADELTSLLVRTTALRDAERVMLERLSPHLPARDNLARWLDLADELAQVSLELGAQMRAPADAAAQVGGRWEAIAALEQAYLALMAQRGLQDISAARRAALAQGRCRAGSDIVLVGAVDLPGIVREMLAQAADRVTALVHAAASDADAFGPMGELVVEAWVDRKLVLRPESIVTVDRPRDQARAVLEAIGRASNHGKLSPDDVTIGLGDEALATTVARTLELAGVPTRVAAGRPLVQCRPALLLEVVRRYLASRRFDDFAALLRHPDVTVHMEGVASSLTLLDRYQCEHVQSRVTGSWLGGEAPRLRDLYDQVHAWLPQHPTCRQSLTDWVGPIARMFGAVYQHVPLERYDPASETVIQALSAIGQVMGALAALEPDALPRVTADGAIAVLLSRLRGLMVPPTSNRAAVELLGYLELPLDDAPRPILVGVNEGAVPSSVATDPLLANSLRRRLGLPDNERRYARDLYALTAVTQSRPDAVIITGRRRADGEPLLPSRLLLTCQGDELVQRVNAFFAEREPAPLPPLIAPGLDGDTGLYIRRPQRSAEPMGTLPVTAFRDYFACPYRFYLRHVLGLEGLDDTAVEMSGGLFGTVAHRVLREFGHSELAASTDADQVEPFLLEKLEELVRWRFGSQPVAAVVLQKQQLEVRLSAFARRQVQWVSEGWRILPDHVEKHCKAELIVDGEPFIITGRVDRIDEHPELGYRIIDYKTSDSAAAPNKTHRSGGKWIDLQLPLYRQLAIAAAVDGAIELGYVLLPRDLAQVGWVPSGWDRAMVDSAVAAAEAIIRAVRVQRFWPPGDVPAFDDGFAGLCYDRVSDRSTTWANAVDGGTS